ncbi:hypothetical protein ACK8N7_01375 [Streptomyces griseobrunneus]|uniref:hypothetical protein n=1 Tax=Streptomyces microflavus TaxID=1919 RepID=UPI00381E81DA
MRAVGNELAARLVETVNGLELDNRAMSMDRALDEEEVLPGGPTPVRTERLEPSEGWQVVSITLRFGKEA